MSRVCPRHIETMKKKTMTTKKKNEDRVSSLFINVRVSFAVY